MTLRIILAIVFCAVCAPQVSVAAQRSTNVSDFLCEYGISLFDHGNLNDAQSQFKKALLLDPSNKAAKAYLSAIEKKRAARNVAPAASVLPPGTLDQAPRVLSEPPSVVVYTPTSMSARNPAARALEFDSKVEALSKAIQEKESLLAELAAKQQSQAHTFNERITSLESERKALTKSIEEKEKLIASMREALNAKNTMDLSPQGYSADVTIGSGRTMHPVEQSAIVPVREDVMVTLEETMPVSVAVPAAVSAPAPAQVIEPVVEQPVFDAPAASQEPSVQESAVETEALVTVTPKEAAKQAAFERSMKEAVEKLNSPQSPQP